MFKIFKKKTLIRMTRFILCSIALLYCMGLTIGVNASDWILDDSNTIKGLGGTVEYSDLELHYEGVAQLPQLTFRDTEAKEISWPENLNATLFQNNTIIDEAVNAGDYALVLSGDFLGNGNHTVIFKINKAKSKVPTVNATYPCNAESASVDISDFMPDDAGTVTADLTDDIVYPDGAPEFDFGFGEGDNITAYLGNISKWGEGAQVVFPINISSTNYEDVQTDVIFTVKCANDGTDSSTTLTRNVKSPTCDEDGYTGDTCCAICGGVISKGEIKKAFGHDYDVTYTWSEDGKSCKASAVCKTEGCNDFIEEKATILSGIKTPATETSKGVTTYTARFNNTDVFETQTKDVEDIPVVEKKEDTEEETSQEESKNEDDKEDTSGDKNKDSSKSDDENYSSEWIKGKWYNVDGTQTYEPLGSWHYNGIGWWYQDESGWYPKSMWQKIDGKWYYFDADGYMVSRQYVGQWSSDPTGAWWLGDNGDWDYPERGSWKATDDGRWWYGDISGWYAKNTWLMINGYWFYFDAEGYMASNEWIDGFWVDASGRWTYAGIGSWYDDGAGWTFGDSKGWHAVDTWQKIDGNWYYFDATGHMVADTVIDGYKIGPNGVCE